MLTIKHSGGSDPFKRMTEGIQKTPQECARIAVEKLNAKNLHCDECDRDLVFHVENGTAVAGGCIHFKDVINEVAEETADEYAKSLGFSKSK